MYQLHPTSFLNDSLKNKPVGRPFFLLDGIFVNYHGTFILIIKKEY
jgi:hypothetical protein